MKGDKQVIKFLNDALSKELTAINQYFLHSRMADNWGLAKMAKEWRDESIEEMQHADKYIQRILFLEGLPNMQNLNKLLIGENVKEIVQCDLKLELDGIKNLKAAIAHCQKVGDEGSYRLFSEILADEEGHVDHLESYLWQIDNIGIQNFIKQMI